ncbi:MAG TPA: hypothetical protein PKB10_10240, partial [Tepidisphaeraceae bacterium]|nr:hypothetical protein [Tepidisphaeraceae bacterium]
MVIRLMGYQLWHRAIPLVRAFRFGMVELYALDHVVLACDFEIDGMAVRGFAGENLVPRWFIKDSSLPIDTERRRLVDAVHAIARVALELPASGSVFGLWWSLYRRSRATGIVQPALLAQLAESLVERAAIDAACRQHGRTFRAMLREDRLGFDPAQVDPA